VAVLLIKKYRGNVMISHLKILLMILLMFYIFFYSNSLAGDQPDKWQKASKNMVHALKNGPDGLKQSVLQNIIRYSDHLQVDEAVFEIMSIYRSHPDERVRQLALVALYKMNNNWALSFLERAIKFERSPKLRKSICAILHQCNRPVDLEGTLLASAEK
jgi:hypothetical protein